MKTHNSTDDTIPETRYVDTVNANKLIDSSASNDALINLIKNGKYILSTNVATNNDTQIKE